MYVECIVEYHDQALKKDIQVGDKYRVNKQHGELLKSMKLVIEAKEETKKEDKKLPKGKVEKAIK